MTEIQAKPARNQAIECARMVAACFVVFIHCPFPGEFGAMIDCLGKLAVPMFFAISGYFSFQIESERIRSQLKHILKLYVFAELLYLLWGIFKIEFAGGSTVAYLIAAIPESDEVAKWFFLNRPPYVGHLWYLLAVAVCELLLWQYVKFFGKETVNYRYLYMAGAFLLANSLMGNALAEAFEDDRRCFWYSDALLYGVPMFTLGIFLHEFQSRILENFCLTKTKLLIMVLAGTCLGLIQWWGGIKTGAIHYGTLLTLVGLMLFLSQNPLVASGRFFGWVISHFGFLSTVVYISHLMVMDAYDLFMRAGMERLLGWKEPWLRPVFAVLASVILAVLCDAVRTQTKRILTRCRKRR